MRRQSRVGPTLEVICATLLDGHLRDERGHDVQRIECEPEAADLLIALLGHDARAGHRACSVCEDVAAGNWTRVLAATATPPGVVIDAERMVGLTRTIFESGGHRGADPFGYRTIRDVQGRT